MTTEDYAALDRSREIARVCAEEFRATLAQMAEKASANIGAAMLAEIEKRGPAGMTFPTKEKDSWNFDPKNIIFCETRHTRKGQEGFDHVLRLDEFIAHVFIGTVVSSTQSFFITNQGRIGTACCLNVDEEKRSVTLPSKCGQPVRVSFGLDDPTHPHYQPLCHLNKDIINVIRSRTQSSWLANMTYPQDWAIRALIQAYRAGCPKINEIHDLWLIQQETKRNLETIEKQQSVLKTHAEELEKEKAKLATERRTFESEKKALMSRTERQSTRERAFTDRSMKIMVSLRTAATSIIDSAGVSSESATFLATEALELVSEADTELNKGPPLN